MYESIEMYINDTERGAGTQFNAGMHYTLYVKTRLGQIMGCGPSGNSWLTSCLGMLAAVLVDDAELQRRVAP
jgi:hypothetical protein